MKKKALTLIFALSFGWVFSADCQDLLLELRLPVKMKAAGKPKAAKWEQVEKMMTQIREAAQGQTCELKFSQVFYTEREELFFPLISNVLRTAPEESLVGLNVYNTKGEELGAFENRVTYEKQGEYNYVHYYFQFRTPEGDLESTGNRLLVDIGTGKPLYMVKWADLAGRYALSLK